MKKGFTLIELMIVVVIISILAATIIPKVQEKLVCGGRFVDHVACKEFKRRHPAFAATTNSTTVNNSASCVVQEIGGDMVVYNSKLYKLVSEVK